MTLFPYSARFPPFHCQGLAVFSTGLLFQARSALGSSRAPRESSVNLSAVSLLLCPACSAKHARAQTSHQPILLTVQKPEGGGRIAVIRSQKQLVQIAQEALLKLGKCQPVCHHQLIPFPLPDG